VAVARFTEAWARSAPAGQYTDETLRGFMCVVGRTATTWYAQCMVHGGAGPRGGGGKQVKLKIGNWPEVPQEQARRRAADALAGMRRGEDPAEERRARAARSATLADALEAHLDRKERRPRTEADYRYYLRHYAPDWMGRRVEAVGADRAGVKARVQRIGRECGPAAADSFARVLRAVYNSARRDDPGLPPNPCENVDFRGAVVAPFEMPAPEALRAWARAALALPGERGAVARDVHLLLVLSGLRPDTAVEARASWLRGGVLACPAEHMKGGRDFLMPLSPPLADLLAARAARAGDGGWLFPSYGATGHVHRQVRNAALQRAIGRTKVYDLRKVYANLTHRAGVPLLETQVLMDHSPRRQLGATAHYLVPDPGALREAQCRASAAILGALGLRHEAGAWPPAVAS
jgi:integrase